MSQVPATKNNKNAPQLLAFVAKRRIIKPDRVAMKAI
jgi:hypothetical protein